MNTPSSLPGLLRCYLDWRLSPATSSAILIALAALGLALLHPAWWAWLLGAFLLHHLTLTLAGLWPRSRLLGENWTSLPESAIERDEVAITIDDGPDPEVTPRVLEILAQHGAAATFFCIGERAAQHPELCLEITQRGHAVENHSQQHSNFFAFYGPLRTRREIRQGQDTLSQLSGQTPLFFRPPAGIRSPLLHPVLQHLGLRHASWSRRGFDTRESDPEVVLNRLLHKLGSGSILLLHDGHAARTPQGIPVILEVLPRLLDHLAQCGLKPVTLRSTLPDQP